MNEKTHTPGPWFAAGSSILARGTTDTFSGSVSGTIAYAESLDQSDIEGRNWHTSGNRDANARLIAAAPDLLEALEEIRDLLWSRPDISDRLRPLMGFSEEATNQKAAMAIAKARGQI
jgi:hypothetical protein